MRAHYKPVGRGMDSTHITKLLSLHERGVITTPEIANSLLIDLIGDTGPDAELPSFVAGLPDLVRKQLLDLLQEIRMAGYCWKPFMLGPGGSVLHTEADDSARLRRLCTASGVA
jgi:hypothetical protein